MSKNDCGKNCFFQRFIEEDYEPEFSKTYNRDQIICHRDVLPVGEKLKLNFVLNRSPFGNTFLRWEPQYDLILILIDLSLDNVGQTIDTLQKSAEIHFPGTKVLLVGTKSDSCKHSSIPDEVIPCSALNGDGFDEVEYSLIQHLGFNSEITIGQSIKRAK